MIPRDCVILSIYCIYNHVYQKYSPVGVVIREPPRTHISHTSYPRTRDSNTYTAPSSVVVCVFFASCVIIFYFILFITAVALVPLSRAYAELLAPMVLHC